MKKAVAFLLAFLIFVTPVTTLVKADVVIGDNDNTIINENATILGRKLALMESLSDLALSGVTEFSISNVSDIDTYLDSLWGEVNDAIDALSNGTGFQQISDELKSKYFTNLVSYKDYINNRGNYLTGLLPSGNPTTTLLQTFFADNVFGKATIRKSNLSLNAFQALSRYRPNDSSVDIPTDYASYINTVNGNSGSGLDFYWKNYSINGGSFITVPSSITSVSYCTATNNWSQTGDSIVDSAFNSRFLISNLITFNINKQPNDELYTITMSGYYPYDYNNWVYSFQKAMWKTANQTIQYYGDYVNNNTFNKYWVYNYSSFSNKTLTECLSYISYNFRNVNIYVDGVPWSVVGDSNINPSLDIDGYLKLYGNDEPVQYELQPNTQIDYDQLYQVIYNAIRDNLPISQGDINYYDSHDTIYSPTIINNYGEDEGNESDLIDTILDYAVIPKFDTAIAQPMRQALTNGVVIMNNSITNVIPNEILIILGACFFLLLFAVVINRMIK